MEQLIRQALNDYSRIKAEIAMFERHLEGRENAEMRGALALREIQMGAIESWFRLLDTDEKAALRLALMGRPARSEKERTPPSIYRRGLAGREVSWHQRSCLLRRRSAS